MTPTVAAILGYVLHEDGASQRSQTWRGVLVVGAVLASLAVTQTVTVTIPPDTPFQIAFKHDQLEMARYRWWCDGAIVKNFTEGETMPVPLVADANGIYTIVATVPGLPAGTHSCFVSAYNGVGETKAAAIPIVVAVPKAPSMPFDLRVVVTVKGGG